MVQIRRGPKTTSNLLKTQAAQTTKLHYKKTYFEKPNYLLLFIYRPISNASGKTKQKLAFNSLHFYDFFLTETVKSLSCGLMVKAPVT